MEEFDFELYVYNVIDGCFVCCYCQVSGDMQRYAGLDGKKPFQDMHNNTSIIVAIMDCVQKVWHKWYHTHNEEEVMKLVDFFNSEQRDFVIKQSKRIRSNL